MRKWGLAAVVAAGLMGGLGVAIAAAGTHAGGGDMARVAAEFLIAHAAVVLVLGLSVVQGLGPPSRWLLCAAVMAFGTLLFSADLALNAFQHLRPFPIAAPVGGMGMLAGWLLLSICAAASLRRENTTAP